MVKEIKKESKEYFECNICKFLYKEEKWAKKCQDWCSKNKSCNLEITKKAVKINSYLFFIYFFFKIIKSA